MKSFSNRHGLSRRCHSVILRPQYENKINEISDCRQTQQVRENNNNNLEIM